MARKKGCEKNRKTINWILSILLFFSCTVYGFSFASTVFATLGILILPLVPIQKVIDKIVPRKKALRIFLAVVIFVIGCCLAPQTDVNATDPASPSGIHIGNQGTTSPSTAPPSGVPTSPEVGSNSATQPSAESTQAHTTAPTRPATEPSTSPTQPTMEPTVPTTQPTIPPVQPTIPPSSSPTTPPEVSSFEIHFIDVGQADAALVLCDGKAMLIDSGNVSDSSLIYTYLKKHNITHLDYVIGTHAHEDHIGGLAGALNFATVDIAYCPTTSYNTDAFSNFVKALDKQGVTITVPTAGTSFNFGSAVCKILAVNTDRNDPNNSSIVLRIEYGNTSFLFAADAERDTEQAILNSDMEIHSTVLKVGHHGSDTSTSYVWLREIMPQYAVISVGTGNSYGHPTEDVLSRLRDADVKTYRTDMQGDIICISDGTTVTFIVDKNEDADIFEGIGNNSTQNPTGPDEYGSHYVLNTSTKKFHHPDCSSAKRISEKNRKDFYGTRDELITMGYDPCGNCDP